MSDVLIGLSNGTHICSPASLKAITTFVLLEEESWFEKEFAFLPHIVRPGATVIDIGANLGTYAMAMAKLVGPQGRAFAYEPTSETRAMLERTRQANGADNLTIVGKALSDGERTGHIVFGGSSELNHLGDDGEGEEVEITSLDVERARLGWAAPDFIKIDAEGEEIPILNGARQLLADASPVLMLEVSSPRGANKELISAVGAMGYDAYRSLPGAPLLVPLGDPSELDAFEINFFAIKPDRAAELEGAGLLVRALPRAEVTADDVARALANLRSQKFAAGFPPQFATGIEVNPDYARALAGYDIWRDGTRSPGERFAALDFGVKLLTALCERGGRITQLVTLARMAAEAGQRRTAITMLDAVVKATADGRLSLGEPFWPASARFDALPQAGRPGPWFLVGVVEAYELLRSQSGAFARPSPHLAQIAASSFASTRILRRKKLKDIQAGRPGPMPDRLLADAGDHVNAALWRDGTVDGLGPILEVEAAGHAS